MDWVQLIKNEGYQEFAPEVKGEAGEGQGKSNDGRKNCLKVGIAKQGLIEGLKGEPPKFNGGANNQSNCWQVRQIESPQSQQQHIATVHESKHNYDSHEERARQCHEVNPLSFTSCCFECSNF